MRREPAREHVVLQASAVPLVPQPHPATPTAPAAAVPLAATPPSKRPSLVAEPGINKKPIDQSPIAKVEPKLNNFDRMLLTRAAVELAEDFSFGLDSWESRSSAVQWTYDRTGFIRPKGLAVYRPSMNLTTGWIAGSPSWRTGWLGGWMTLTKV